MVKRKQIVVDRSLSSENLNDVDQELAQVEEVKSMVELNERSPG
jgi:hypothetical protein